MLASPSSTPCVPRDLKTGASTGIEKLDPTKNRIEDFERLGGTAIIAENGFLAPVDKTYYAVSVHQHNGAGWAPVGPEDRFTKLGIPMKPWMIRPVDGYRLICGQRGVGSKLMRCPTPWVYTLVEDYKRKGVPYRFRAHPGNHAPKIPLTNDLRGAASPSTSGRARPACKPSSKVSKSSTRRRIGCAKVEVTATSRASSHCTG